MEIGSFSPFSIVTKGGAPMASCKDLAPTLLAFSKRVNFGGPTLISEPSRRGFFRVFFPDLEGGGTKPRTEIRYLPRQTSFQTYLTTPRRKNPSPRATEL